MLVFLVTLHILFPGEVLQAVLIVARKTAMCAALVILQILQTRKYDHAGPNFTTELAPAQECIRHHRFGLVLM